MGVSPDFPIEGEEEFLGDTGAEGLVSPLLEILGRCFGFVVGCFDETHEVFDDDVFGQAEGVGLVGVTRVDVVGVDVGEFGSEVEILAEHAGDEFLGIGLAGVEDVD